jgi:serine/threonine protein kinase/DNA-binding beta-propeller fold protein YncE
MNCWSCSVEVAGRAAACGVCGSLLLVREKYRIQSRLGEGGMGVVYRALDRALGREVALKLMHGHVAGVAQKRDRFFSECRAMARLNHPAIARIYEADVHHDQLYFAQELVEGQPLSAWLAKGLRSSTDRCEFLRLVLVALQHAHGQGIAHRDLNPNNVMVVEREGLRPVLIDFGMARLRNQEGTQAAWGGTIGFAAPEQLLDPASNDVRSDLYAVGALAYALFTRGERPYGAVLDEEVKSNPHAMLAVYRCIADGEVLLEKPELEGAELRLWPLVARALSPLPEDRFPSADAMLDAFEEALNGQLPQEKGTLDEGAAAEGSRPAPESSDTWPDSDVDALEGAGRAHLFRSAATRSAPVARSGAASSRFSSVRRWQVVSLLLALAVGLFSVQYVFRASDSSQISSAPSAGRLAPHAPGAKKAAAPTSPIQGFPSVHPTPFIFPAGICASDEAVYVADQGADRIQVYRWAADSKSVVTFAGSGRRGFADGPVKEAFFDKPADVELLPSGALLVADAGNHRIRKIQNGQVVTLAGAFESGMQDGPAKKARFRYPLGVAVSRDGSILIADTGNNRIRRIADGEVSTLLGSLQRGQRDGAAAEARVNAPVDLIEASDGGLYFIDAGSMTLRRFKEGRVTTLASLGQARTKPWRGHLVVRDFAVRPRLAVDDKGTVFVSDPRRRQVWRLVDGELRSFAGTGKSGNQDDYAPKAEFRSPQGIACSKEGVVWVSDTEGGALRKISGGKVVTSAESPQGGFADGKRSLARFNHPWALAIDSKGRLVVADWLNYRIRVVSELRVSTILGTGDKGTHEGHGLDSELRSPRDVAIAGDTIYVADALSRRIVVVAKGRVSSLRSPLLKRPEAVAVGSGGEIYVADTGASQIFVVKDGVFSVLAGDGVPGFKDGAAKKARFLQPSALAIDKGGVIYVVDTGNHRLRMIREGWVRTLAGTGEPGFGDGQQRDAKFESPKGLAVAEDGSIYVADTGNHRVRRVQDGLVTTVAGRGTPGWGDGSALEGALALPSAVMFGSKGRLFIADSGNQLIRILEKGMLSTYAGQRFGSKQDQVAR